MQQLHKMIKYIYTGMSSCKIYFTRVNNPTFFFFRTKDHPKFTIYSGLLYNAILLIHALALFTGEGQTLQKLLGIKKNWKFWMGSKVHMLTFHSVLSRVVTTILWH